LAECFRKSLFDALEDNEKLHAKVELLKRKRTHLSCKANRASQFSLILKAIIDEAESEEK